MKYLVIDCFNFTMVGASVALNISDIPDKYPFILKNMLNKMLVNLSSRFTGYEIYGVWDTYGGTFFRKDIVPEYKANRDNSKYDFRVIESMKSVYEENDIKNISIPECEADDAIYVLCKILKEEDPNNTVVIVSRDEDMIQVVQSGYADRIWDNTKKEFKEIPSYPIVDMKALTGDKSDNIKGVDGIGPKTALKIIDGTKVLTEDQKVLFERYKNIIDASRHPRLQENYKYMKELIYEMELDKN